MDIRVATQGVADICFVRLYSFRTDVSIFPEEIQMYCTLYYLFTKMSLFKPLTILLLQFQGRKPLLVHMLRNSEIRKRFTVRELRNTIGIRSDSILTVLTDRG